MALVFELLSSLMHEYSNLFLFYGDSFLINTSDNIIQSLLKISLI